MAPSAQIPAESGWLELDLISHYQDISTVCLARVQSQALAHVYAPLYLITRRSGNQHLATEQSLLHPDVSAAHSLPPVPPSPMAQQCQQLSWMIFISNPPSDHLPSPSSFSPETTPTCSHKGNRHRPMYHSGVPTSKPHPFTEQSGHDQKKHAQTARIARLATALPNPRSHLGIPSLVPR